MGQENSTPIDEHTPPDTLESRTLEALAKYIKDGEPKKIVVMTGAGISTSAGIPDFRSPETGLYANLAKLNLPYAEAVFDISFFRNNPEPFYTLAQELYPGKYRPTITHSFIKLLHDKGLLLKCFTQNIDTLEREAGVPGDKMVEAHGSFAGQKCIECRAPYPDALIKIAIHEKTVPHCEACNGLVKPNIVFFGEALPEEFFLNRHLPATADLAIVMGTSLTVQPFAGLPSECAPHIPRLLINKEVVGDFGYRADDVPLIGDCDTGVRALAEACGWLEELEALWAQTQPIAAVDMGRKEPVAETETTDQRVEDEVERLTRQVEETLHKTETHRDYVNGFAATHGAGRPQSGNVEDLASQVRSALNISRSQQDYLDRQVDAKTGKSYSDMLEPGSPVMERLKEELKVESSVAEGGAQDRGLRHIFPYAETESKGPPL
ncbi:NAD-dependent deacetylase sirtuin-2 [Pseudovirgaria hyperparasitica]|uniref:NAD-dependent deacetylase sirtuin-2 n=1 Tax=Pseudovirgaria hyperparasitica TaxID=470096 RepID=A0A6A6VWP5_9PEZI|nr:NAD-dependent deacetylase sirtuin-2 [Pseudovirgaria hyperparasitica]KAF2753677.1 NAD-dependent deacetylase sirtuin-2 [Pseudovirgaria hyperparasitica]